MSASFSWCATAGMLQSLKMTGHMWRSCNCKYEMQQDSIHRCKKAQSHFACTNWPARASMRAAHAMQGLVQNMQTHSARSHSLSATPSDTYPQCYLITLTHSACFLIALTHTFRALSAGSSPVYTLISSSTLPVMKNSRVHTNTCWAATCPLA